jgi:hypothetical protein
MKNILLLFALMLLTSCDTVSDMRNAPSQSAVRTYEKSSIDVTHSPTVLLRMKEDRAKFSGNVSGRLERLGFKIAGNGERPDYYADVEYKTYFDVVHQTFVYFEIAFTDAKTDEVRLRLRYVGGGHGLNGCDTALNLLFWEVSQNLKKGITAE